MALTKLQAQLVDNTTALTVTSVTSANATNGYDAYNASRASRSFCWGLDASGNYGIWDTTLSVTSRLTIDSSGNVGIGTSSPASGIRSTIKGAAIGSTQLRLEQGNATDGWDFTASGVDGSLAFSRVSASGATITERARIDSSGNLLVGTSTNNVFDGVAQPRPLLVQSSSSTTSQYNSTNSITICNSDTTTSNASQINFATITGASANQYSAAVISCIYGARTNGQYPTGVLTFGTSTSTNVAPSEKMRIDSVGRVTKPYQPAFFAYHSGQGNWTTEQDLSCDVADLNVGNCYNTSTFRFTAPIAGTYLFEFHTMNHQSNTGASYSAIQKNGTTYHYFHIVNNHPSSCSSTVIFSLAAGDYISFRGSNMHYNGGSANKYPKICGYLLG